MKIFKTFFYKGDDFQPPYFWMTASLILGTIAFIMKLAGCEHLSDTLIIALWSKVVVWAGIYNYDRIKNGKH